jgi:hypothetical protein
VSGFLRTLTWLIWLCFGELLMNFAHSLVRSNVERHDMKRAVSLNELDILETSAKTIHPPCGSSSRLPPRPRRVSSYEIFKQTWFVITFCSVAGNPGSYFSLSLVCHRLCRGLRDELEAGSRGDAVALQIVGLESEFELLQETAEDVLWSRWH